MDTLHVSNVCLMAAGFFYSLNMGPMMFESFTSDRTCTNDSRKIRSIEEQTCHTELQ